MQKKELKQFLIQLSKTVLALCFCFEITLSCLGPAFAVKNKPNLMSYANLPCAGEVYYWTDDTGKSISKCVSSSGSSSGGCNLLDICCNCLTNIGDPVYCCANCNQGCTCESANISACNIAPCSDESKQCEATDGGCACLAAAELACTRNLLGGQCAVAVCPPMQTCVSYDEDGRSTCKCVSSSSGSSSSGSSSSSSSSSGSSSSTSSSSGGSSGCLATCINQCSQVAENISNANIATILALFNAAIDNLPLDFNQLVNALLGGFNTEWVIHQQAINQFCPNACKLYCNGGPGPKYCVNVPEPMPITSFWNCNPLIGRTITPTLVGSQLTGLLPGDPFSPVGFSRLLATDPTGCWQCIQAIVHDCRVTGILTRVGDGARGLCSGTPENSYFIGDPSILESSPSGEEPPEPPIGGGFVPVPAPPVQTTQDSMDCIEECEEGKCAFLDPCLDHPLCYDPPYSYFGNPQCQSRTVWPGLNTAPIPGGWYLSNPYNPFYDYSCDSKCEDLHTKWKCTFVTCSSSSGSSHLPGSSSSSSGGGQLIPDNADNKPSVAAYTVKYNSKNKQIVQVILSGKNLVLTDSSGLAAKQRGKEKIKNNLLTRIEFKNTNIKIIRSLIKNKKGELVITVKLPKGYRGGIEELIISTPNGQTSIELELSRVKK